MVIDFTGRDLAATRFAISPLGEAIDSFVALRFPDEHPLLLPWIREVESRVEGLDTDLLDRLITYPFSHQRQGSRMYADFLVSYPRHTMVTIEEELDELAATPPEAVFQDIRANYGALDPEPFRIFMDAPADAMRSLAEELRAYWDAAMAPGWSAIRTVLENDVLYRAHLLTDSGLAQLLASFGREYAFDGEHLTIEGLFEGACDVEWSLSGQGIVLAPSVFKNSAGFSITPGRAILRYRARGVAMAFNESPFRPEEALVGLIGRPRAALLMRLGMPATTSDLASHFGVTPGAISQQLAFLKGAGLATTRRAGSRSLHMLTVVGHVLMDAYRHPDRVAVAWEDTAESLATEASMSATLT